MSFVETFGSWFAYMQETMGPQFVAHAGAIVLSLTLMLLYACVVLLFVPVRTEPSLLEGEGTKSQRGALFLLIERGRMEYTSALPEQAPGEPFPLITFSWKGLESFLVPYNSIGLALLGLHSDPPVVAHAYHKWMVKFTNTGTPGSQVPYEAAAQLLGLPVNLLLATQRLVSELGDEVGLHELLV